MKISVAVKPNSKHLETVEEVEGEFVVCVKAAPLEGRANVRVTELLAKHFGVAKTKIKLVRGATSRHKVFEVDI